MKACVLIFLFFTASHGAGCCSDSASNGFCSDPNSKITASDIMGNDKYCCRAPGSVPQFSNGECFCSTPTDGTPSENCPGGSAYYWYAQPDAGLCMQMPDNTCQAWRQVVCRRYKGIYDDGFCVGPGSSPKPLNTVACSRGTCTLPGRIATTGGKYILVDRSVISPNKIFGPYFTVTAKRKLIALVEDSKSWADWFLLTSQTSIVVGKTTRLYAMKDASDIADLARDVILGASDSTGPLNVPKVWIGGNSPDGLRTPYKWTTNEVIDTSIDFNWNRVNNEPNYLIGVSTGPDESGEQCIAAVTTTAEFRWMDYYCSARLPALIEVENVSVEYRFEPWPDKCPATELAPCGSYSRAERSRSCVLNNFQTLGQSLTIPVAHCERVLDLTPELVNKNAAVRVCIACQDIPTDASFLSDAMGEFDPITGDRLIFFLILAFVGVGGHRL